MGNAGLSEAPPVFCDWRWHYHLPYLGLWVLIGLALVVPEGNRNRQAWLILVPLFLVMALWQMPVRLLSLPSSSANLLGFLVNSVAMAWTVVWLLGHRLGAGRRVAGFSRMLAVMLVVGVWSYVGDYGTGLTSEAFMLLIPFAVGALALLLPMALARLCCRGRDRPGPFMAWLFLWMALASFAGMLLFAVTMAIIQFSMFLLLIALLQAAVMSLFLAVTLYLINLPFMLLAFKSPFYRERFRSTFGLETKRGESPFAQRGESPFAAPVDVTDGEPASLPAQASQQAAPPGRD